MIVKVFTFVVSFALLLWLLIDCSLQLDIAATKNDHLIRSEKIKIDEMEHIDSVKVYAKAKLDSIRKGAQTDGDFAKKRIKLILTLSAVQLLLFVWCCFGKQNFSRE
jgi:hypothetical protein